MDELNTAKKELKVIMDRVDMEKAELDQVLLSINSAKGEMDALQSEIFRLQNTAKLESERVGEYKTLRGEYEKELDEKNEAKKVLSSGVTKVSEELKTKTAEAVKVQKETEGQIASLKTEQDSIVAEAKKKLSEIEVDVEEGKNELKSLLEEIAKKEQTHASFVSAIKQSGDKLGELKDQENSLTSQIENCKENLVLVEGYVKTAQNTETDVNTLIEALRATVDELTANKEALEDEIEVLKQQKVDAEAEYEVAQNKMFALSEREDKLKQREAFIKDKYEKAGVEYK